MRLNLSADELLTTTRSVRKRLDFDRPVEREVVMECLEIALQAPTGSNRQGWQWVFVEDEARKLALRDIYRPNFQLYRSMPRPQYEAGDPRAERADRVVDSADYLSENFHRVPVMMIPCLKGRPEEATGPEYHLQLDDVGRLAVFMASLPTEANMFETTILPIQQRSFIGRG